MVRSRRSASSAAPTPTSLAEAPPSTRRLFAGIDLDADTRAACHGVSGELRKTGFAAKYEAPEKLHVTLAFLGNVEESRGGDIASALASAAAGVKPFAVVLDKLGAFPHERKPRVVYIGARDQGLAFRSLGQNLRTAYTAMGFMFENDPVAHVTIARAKDSKRPLPLVEFSPIRLAVRGIALFESLFDKERKTSRYEIIKTAPLLSS
jgi:RNA 2',3'-cyclic 3'-phosphodiesterase